MALRIILWTLFGIAVFMALPSTMFFGVFVGVFRRKKYVPGGHEFYGLTESGRETVRRGAEMLKALPHTEISLTARDGVRLAADYIDRGSDKTVILVHGYRADPYNNFAPYAEGLISRGYNLLIIHQRAHGKSRGRYTGMGARERYDLLDWIDLVTKNGNISRVAVCGISMGGATVGLASGSITSDKVKALVTDCAYTDFAREFVHRCNRKKFPPRYVAPAVALYAKLFLHADIRADVCESLKKSKIPVFVLQGGLDTVVPPVNAERIFASCPPGSEHLTVPESRIHARALLEGGDAAAKRVFGFLDKYMQ